LRNLFSEKSLVPEGNTGGRNELDKLNKSVTYQQETGAGLADFKVLSWILFRELIKENSERLSWDTRNPA